MPTSDAAAGDRALGLPAHGGYACRDSGVCCSSDWEIPVEASLHDRLAPALADGRLRLALGGAGLVARDGLPAGLRSVLGRWQGRCVFHDGGAGGCRLHAWGGADAKPVACRQFPWLAVHDPRGTFVSLSHVCPTAAALLRQPSRLSIEALPHDARAFDGLDVRRALPPALDERRLADWDAVSAWERQALAACQRAGRPEDVAGDLAALLSHARRWRAPSGPLASWITAWTPAAAGTADAWRPEPALDTIVRSAVPAVWVAPPAPGLARRRPQWDAMSTLMCRYLAARLVACWPLHFGRGLATVVAYVEALLAVVATELARRGAIATPDEGDVLAAIAEADRLAIHLAAPDTLAAGLDGWSLGAGL